MQPLTRPHIVAAGLRLLEREGAAGLSMRKLADELGKAPAAVYKHVSDKRELMSLLFDEVSRRIELPGPGDDPRSAIMAAAQSAHRVLEAHGWIATGMIDGPLLGVTSMRLSEFILDALVRKGMSDVRAARLQVAIWEYLVGHLVAARAGAQVPFPRPEAGGEDAEDYPTVRRVAPLVAEMSDQERFDAGLRVLLDGVFTEPDPTHTSDTPHDHPPAGADPPSVSQSTSGTRPTSVGQSTPVSRSAADVAG
ncbi:TetR/AcrR family transcriptional regulator [Streptomyces sp. NPDC006660]|uniref:TetR/AcrR family transcriptional regulator n=1 Tax=unclassified Streptomyces TaxID=2593676 RepID=UPI0033DCD37E